MAALVLLVFLVFCWVGIRIEGCGLGPYDLSSYGEQRFIGPADGWLYSLSPCQTNALCLSNPSPTAVCLESPDGTEVLSIAHVSGIGWTYVNGEENQGAQLYSTGDSGTWDGCAINTYSSSTVDFICSAPDHCGDDTIIITQYGSANNGNCDWIFQVNSKVVCSVLYPEAPCGGGGGGSVSSSSTGNGGGGGNEKNSGGGGGLSGGWVFVIILLVSFFVYCAAGIAFMRIRKGATGAAMIPNVEFWKELPGLMKDGCIFTYRKIRAVTAGGGGGGGGGGESTGFTQF